MLAFAGGFSGNAYTEAVRVSRLAGQENELYNVHADEFGGYSMQNGDVVTVGRALDRYTNRVQVRGQVMRPGFYALGAECSLCADSSKKHRDSSKTLTPNVRSSTAKEPT